MKTKSIIRTLIGLIVIIVILFQSCKKDDEKVNQNPTCTITSPSNGQEIMQGETITISVQAQDSDGTIEEVQFYIDGIEKESVNSFPYTYSWNTGSESISSHQIKVISIDNSGGSNSDEISVNIIENITPENKWEVELNGTIGFIIRLDDVDSNYFVITSDNFYLINNKGDIISSNPTTINTYQYYYHDYEFINENEIFLLMNYDQNESESYLFKVNISGTLDWFKNIVPENNSWTGAANDICKLDNDEFLLSGYRLWGWREGWTVRVNSSGEELMETSYNHRFREIYGCVNYNNSSFIVGKPNGINIANVDINGNISDSALIESLTIGEIILGNDNNLVLFASNSVLKVDHNLNIIWQTTIPNVEFPDNIIKVTDGYVVSYNGWVQKLDEDGNLMIFKSYSNSFYQNIASGYDYGILYSNGNKLVKTNAELSK